MPRKDLILGVDCVDDIVPAFQKGKPTGAPLIREVLDHAVEAGMTAVCWRVSHVGYLSYPSKVGTPIRGAEGARPVFGDDAAQRPAFEAFARLMQELDPLRTAIDEAHERGLKALIYYTLFDEAYTDPETGRVSAESDFGRLHPEFYACRPGGSACVRGVLSFGYPEVREYFAALAEEALSYRPDGVYLDCARTHAGANPIPVHGYWPQWTHPYLAYGYNEPDMALYRERYGEAPPIRGHGDATSLEPTEAELNWNRVRGEALTTFLREVRPLMRAADTPLWVAFYPATYNPFQPGYHCRQMLGRYHIDWRTWVDEGLVDAIRLITDHRRMGHDDWFAASADTYRYAQERGVKVYADACLRGRIDRIEDPPLPLPLSRDRDPETFYSFYAEKVRAMLTSSADGVFFYEHADAAPRTWGALRAAKRAAGIE